MAIVAGIDIGTTYTKGIILDLDGKIAARSMERTGVHHKHLAEHILDDCLEKAGEDKRNLSGVAVTGFGRRDIDTIHNIPVVSFPDVLCICQGVSWLHVDSKIEKNENQIDEKEKNKEQKQKSFLILDIGGEKWKYIYSETAGPRIFYPTTCAP